MTTVREARRQELRAWFEQHVGEFRALEAAFRRTTSAARCAPPGSTTLGWRPAPSRSTASSTRRPSPTAAAASSTPTRPPADRLRRRAGAGAAQRRRRAGRATGAAALRRGGDVRPARRLRCSTYPATRACTSWCGSARSSATSSACPTGSIEVQVRSILQHAWAALQHDLMYKGERAPTDQVRRRLIALAGLLELADQEFMSVRLAHGDAAGMLDDAHAGGFDVAGVRAWAERLAGDEAGTEPVAWAAALRDRAHRPRRHHRRGGDRAAGRVGGPGTASWRGPCAPRGRGPRRRTSPTSRCGSPSAPTTSPAARSPTRPLRRHWTASAPPYVQALEGSS